MTTLKALNARLDGQDARFDRFEAMLGTLLERTAPAKAEVFIPAHPVEARKTPKQARLDAQRGCPKSAHVHNAACHAAQDDPAEAKARQERMAKFEAQRKAGIAAAKRNAPASARLSRKAWNDAFVAKAKFSGLRDPRGVSLYRVALNRWDEVQAMRTNLVSPEKALEALMAGKRWA